MTFETFMELSRRTWATSQLATDTLGNNKVSDAAHALIGIATEAGELLDVFKKDIYYAKETPKTAYIDELGDLLYYVARLCDNLDIDIETAMEANVKKLRTRFPDGFDSNRAQNPDKQLEFGAMFDD